MTRGNIRIILSHATLKIRHLSTALTGARIRRINSLNSGRLSLSVNMLDLTRTGDRIDSSVSDGRAGAESDALRGRKIKEKNEKSENIRNYKIPRLNKTYLHDSASES